MYLNRFVFIVSFLLFHTNSYGEVISDGSVDTRVTPIPETGVFEISHGYQDGTNLFHSFSEFRLGGGEQAAFMGRGVPNPVGVENILARVTGSNPSNIYGQIQINAREFAKANLYLINPNGILFGEGASLDISGSFHATTADYIRLDRDHSYYASLSENSKFSSAPPSAFGFLGKSSPISVHKTLLIVSEGETLSIIGGDIRTENSGLVAPGGRVNLASIASTGEVIPAEFSSSELDPLKLEGLNKGTIKLSGYFSNQNYPAVSVGVSGNGGQIFIRAGRLFANNTYIQADNTCCTPVAEVHGSKDSLVDIAKDSLVDIVVDEDIHLNNTTQIAANNSGNSHQGTSIKVTADTLEIGGMDVVELRSFLDYKTQYTSEELMEEHQMSENDASTFLEKAKELLDEPTVISFEDVIEKFGKQNLADIYRRDFFVRKFNLISIGNLNKSREAGGGKIQIHVRNLQMDTGMIEAYTLGSGNAGEIAINAQNINLTGLSGINAASAFDPNRVTSENRGGHGDGGEITINGYDGRFPAEELTVSDYSYVSTAVDENTTGKGGNLTLNTSRLTLDTAGRINSYSSGTGDAGNIIITADKVLLNDNTYITTEATQRQASGGNINLHVRDWLVLFNSKITAEARGDQKGDDGGNLTINRSGIDKSGPKILALSKSQLLARANQGYGGNIRLRGAKYRLGGSFKVNEGRFEEQFLKERDYNVIDASSKRGVEFYGKIEFNAQPWEFMELQQLPKLQLPPSLNPNRCSFRKEDMSRFIITARDILPRRPEDLRTHTIRLGK